MSVLTQSYQCGTWFVCSILRELAVSNLGQPLFCLSITWSRCRNAYRDLWIMTITMLQYAGVFTYACTKPALNLGLTSVITSNSFLSDLVTHPCLSKGMCKYSNYIEKNGIQLFFYIVISDRICYNKMLVKVALKCLLLANRKKGQW